MSASPQAQAFWAAMAAAPQQVDLPIEQRRAAGERAEDATAEPVGVTITERDDGSLLLRPDDAVVMHRVLYLFGGGYVLGSPASRRKTAAHLALAAGAEVLVPAYRLAPEHPYPAALDDAVDAYRELDAGGGEPIVIAGDSSGGGLALGTALAVRDAGLTPPAGILAFSPWADLTCSGATMSSNIDHDIQCSRDSLLEMAGRYAGGADPVDPLLSPVFAEFAQFPSVLAFAGSEEVLLDDAARVVTAVNAAGGEATLFVGDGMQHVYPIWTGAFPEAGEAIAIAGRWIRALPSPG